MQADKAECSGERGRMPRAKHICFNNRPFHKVGVIPTAEETENQ